MPPIRICTLLFASGIFLTESVQICPLVIPFIGVSGILCIFIFIISSFWGRARFISLHSLWLSCLIYLASIISGGYMYLERINLSSSDISVAAPYASPVSVAGEILTLANKSSYTEIILKAHKVYADTHSTRVKGVLLVRLRDGSNTLAPGMHVLFAGRMNHVKGRRNPGDFDYRSYLAQRNIHAIFEAERWIGLQSTTPPIDSRIRRLIFRARSAVQVSIKDAVPTTYTNALLQALILGDQSHFSAPVLNNFREAGLSHLLAVSGLHVLCVGLILYTLLRPLCLRAGMKWRSMEVTRFLVTLVLLIAYLCLTDFKPAVFRATVMTGVFILAPLFQRPAASINNMFVAGFILLAINPQYLFQPGFQLSFAAVSSIIHFYPRLPSWNPNVDPFSRALSHVVSSTNVSLAAIIGTLPISLFHFQTASIGGLFLNIAAIPATTGLLISGFLVLISTPFNADAAGLFGQSADVFSQALLFLTAKGATLFPSVSMAHWPQLLTLSIVIGLLIFLISSLSLKLRWSSLCLVLSILLIVQWIPILQRVHHPKLNVLFLDVGHGDAALVTFPNGRRMLIDTGDTPWNPDQSVLVHHMDRYQIKCIDAVIITHPDRDHAGGLQSVIEQHCVRSVYTSGDDRFNSDFGGFIPFKTVGPGDSITLDESVPIRILSPPPSLINHPNKNDGSIVLVIEYGLTRFLFLGDAEQEAERQLVEHFSEFLSSEAVKVGHHGSQTSSSSALVEEVSMGDSLIAIISTGDQGRYGLPDNRVVDRWTESGARMHNTAVSRALWLESDGLAIQERRW